MQLFNYIANGASGIGIECAGKRLNFTRAWGEYHPKARDNAPNSIDSMLERGVFNLDAIAPIAAMLEQSGARGDYELKGAWNWATPVLRPGKIVALVRNYRKHAEEFNAQAPSKVLYFSKFPSTMLPHLGEIRLPAWLNSRVDHEAELGFVIGRRCSRVSIDDALSVIAGYTIINDVSARHLQQEAKESGMPWTQAKNIDTFCPVGPYLVPRGAVKDPQALRMTCRVNGEVCQDSTTGAMIHPIAKIIAEVSRALTLEPGDIISTGTPEGVGKLLPGDVVECEIEGLGCLRNAVVAET